jgi:hypothetical protein
MRGKPAGNKPVDDDIGEQGEVYIDYLRSLHGREPPYEAVEEMQNYLDMLPTDQQRKRFSDEVNKHWKEKDFTNPDVWLNMPPVDPPFRSRGAVSYSRYSHTRYRSPSTVHTSPHPPTKDYTSPDYWRVTKRGKYGKKWKISKSGSKRVENRISRFYGL